MNIRTHKFSNTQINNQNRMIYLDEAADNLALTDSENASNSDELDF